MGKDLRNSDEQDSFMIRVRRIEDLLSNRPNANLVRSIAATVVSRAFTSTVPCLIWSERMSVLGISYDVIPPKLTR